MNTTISQATKNDIDFMLEMDKLNLGTFDLVVCNLYPFMENPSIETIDIGGVTCYKLSRKKAVNGGLKSPVYFSVAAFEEVSDD